MNTSGPQASNIEPKDPVVFALLGDVRTARMEFDDAAAMYRSAVTIAGPGAGAAVARRFPGWQPTETYLKYSKAVLLSGDFNRALELVSYQLNLFIYLCIFVLFVMVPDYWIVPVYLRPLYNMRMILLSFIFTGEISLSLLLTSGKPSHGRG